MKGMFPVQTLSLSLKAPLVFKATGLWTEKLQLHLTIITSILIEPLGDSLSRSFQEDFIMNVSKTMETEEDYLTILQLKLFHPQQRIKGMFSLLPVGTRRMQDADDPLRLGRDDLSCALVLVDQKVSRKQLSLQAFHTPQREGMFFCVQNLSKKGHLFVNGSRLGYLQRLDLPDKALVRFGEYEMLVVREPGEAKGSFEVELDVLETSPFTEVCTCAPDRSPVMDTSSEYSIGFTPPQPSESDELLS